jgi:hypothetical protein
MICGEYKGIMQKLPKSRKRQCLTLTLPPDMILWMRKDAKGWGLSISAVAEGYILAGKERDLIDPLPGVKANP